jgi:protein TonB
MKKEKKDKDFIKSPYLEGGRAALDAYVKKELRYPKEALAAKIEGRVSVRYTVDYKGHVIEANIISGIGHGCDEEALRIVRSLQFKVPEDGRIKSKYTRKLHIHFRLPGSPAQLTPTKPIPAGGGFQITYEVTPNPVRPPVPGKKKTSYDIQINLPGRKPGK